MDWVCENCWIPNEDYSDYCMNCGSDAPEEWNGGYEDE